MKNKQTTTFCKMFFLAFFVVSSLNVSLAQTTDSQFMRVKKSDDNAKAKKNDSAANTNKSGNSTSVVTSTTPPPIAQPNYEEMSKGRVKAVGEIDNSVSTAVPVTYVGDEKNMTEVNYAIDSQQSNFDNLKNMIDLRNKVHASNNHATLTQTAKYTQLLSDITTYRSKFNADVDKKGFENCSKKEQSLFLSLLKQEGKQEEYKMYSSKLKQD